MIRNRRLCNRRGAAVVETAIVLPLFLMITLGIVELGRGMMVGELLTEAARLGARQGSLAGSTNLEVEQSVKSFCATVLNTDSANVTVTISITPAVGNIDPGNDLSLANSGDLCVVSVSVPYNTVSFIQPTYLDSKNITGSASIPYE